MNKENNETYKKIIKYLFEGLVIGIVGFYIPSKKMKLDELFGIAATAATALIIVDHFANKTVRIFTRVGMGLGIGSKIINMSEEHFNEQTNVNPNQLTDCNYDFSLSQDLDFNSDCSGDNSNSENCKKIKARQNAEFCKNSPLPNDLNNWKLSKSKYCSLAGDSYNFLASDNFERCLNNNLESCNSSITQYFNSKC